MDFGSRNMISNSLSRITTYPFVGKQYPNYYPASFQRIFWLSATLPIRDYPTHINNSLWIWGCLWQPLMILFFLLLLLLRNKNQNFRFKVSCLAGNDVKLTTTHGLHLFDFSPLWIFKCWLKKLGSKQAKLHWLHLFDFSPLCVFKCRLKLLAWKEA